MGKLTFGEWGGGRIEIWWEGVLPEVFSQVGGMSKFSAGGRDLPPSFPVGKQIYIYTLVPDCVLITLANLNPAIFSVPRGTEKLNKLP